MNAWAMHSPFLGASSAAHSRSISLGPPIASTPRSNLSKAQSASNLRKMSTIEDSPPKEPKGQENSPGTSFRTIADPRNASASDLSRSATSSSKHGDVNPEVAALSDKLISAINHQTTLDDTLAQTKQELEASRARLAKLQAETKEYEARISRGDLLPRETLDQDKDKLVAELAEEKKQKAQAQQEKRGIESELESLTASLFDEANKMVASANRERDTVEKKNQQLRDQIKDGEAVIASQIEQLAQLKTLMQQIESPTDHRKELDSPRVSLAPSSPGATREGSDLARLLEAMNLSPLTLEHGELVPSPSTQFTHLLKPLCRTDIPAYEDFKNLVQTSHFRSHNPSHAASRAGSGSYGGLNVMGLGSLGGNSSQTNLSQPQAATSKLANSPNLPGSFSPNPDPKGPVPLRETKFFKRIVVEDIEPTLRLDLSPTLSWLNRRSVLAALGDSTLIVEPIPDASIKLYGKYTPCALCGENRKQGENPRTHAMRVREGEGATKWCICKLCLEKVRGVGDLVAYIRMVREGVVKVGDKKDEEDAWEELVRLRERLFWARMAGGVVPAFIPTPKQTPVDEEGANTEQILAREDDKENSTPNQDLSTPPEHPAKELGAGSEHSSPGTASSDAEESPDEKAARLQLQNGLDETLTTFENIQSKRVSLGSRQNSNTPPSTPSPQRNHVKKDSSGAGIGFPKISIPKLPPGFWESQVNTLR